MRSIAEGIHQPEELCVIGNLSLDPLEGLYLYANILFHQVSENIYKAVNDHRSQIFFL